MDNKENLFEKTDDLQYVMQVGTDSYRVIEARYAEDKYILCKGTIDVNDYLDSDGVYNSEAISIIQSYYESVEDFEEAYEDQDFRKQVLAEMCFEDTPYYEWDYRIVPVKDIEKEIKSEVEKEELFMEKLEELMKESNNEALISQAVSVSKAAILQLGMEDEQQFCRFFSLKTLKNNIKKDPEGKDYELVHLKEFSKESDLTDIGLCNAIYAEFNSPDLRPADYYGYSLSVSDVIVLYDGNEGFTSYYVDNIGFAKLPDEFLPDYMKSKIKDGMDIYEEFRVLDSKRENDTLPEELGSRLNYLHKHYKKVFDMAEERAVLLAEQDASEKKDLDTKISEAKEKKGAGKELDGGHKDKEMEL